MQIHWMPLDQSQQVEPHQILPLVVASSTQIQHSTLVSQLSSLVIKI
jgi:hypothetical protein